MKIAYVTTYDVLNQETWPKTQPGLCQAAYYISKNIADESVSIAHIGPLQKKNSLIPKVKWNLYHYVLKKDYYRWAEPLIVKDYAYQVDRKLSRLESDIVLFPDYVLPITYLRCTQPIVLWNDSTLGALINFYPYLSNLCQETIKNIYTMEKAALNKCKLAIYTSDWAAQTAIDIYGIKPSKIKVIPWGANIDCDRTNADVYNLVEAKVSSPCKLLFLGRDWIRKGGNVAFEVSRELNKVGLKTELIVVGAKPILNEPMPSYVRVVEFIDKSKPEALEKINSLFAEAHFLILPTIADCSPHALIEANSFGVPCLATNVGGIPTIIKDGLNGKSFSTNADVSEYCSYIVSLMNNYSEYKKLAISSFNEYQARLNWSVACKAVKQLLMELTL